MLFRGTHDPPPDCRCGDRAFAYAGQIDSGGHLDVRISGGVVVAAMPYYGRSDAECCPSKYIVQTFTVSDGRLVKLSERFDTKKAE